MMENKNFLKIGLVFAMIVILVIPATSMARQLGNEVNPTVNEDQTVIINPTDRFHFDININMTGLYPVIFLRLADGSPVNNVTVRGSVKQILGRCFVGKTFNEFIPTIGAGITVKIKTPLQIGLGIMDYNVNVTSQDGTYQTYGPDRYFLAMIKPIDMADPN